MTDEKVRKHVEESVAKLVPEYGASYFVESRSIR